ncbi:hypothetical protein BUY43_06700 [Staphylococcus devriesei]|uniref:Uncharacterized protein n=1 Tax=Staphylococcus devriesei TaxID=586733 RepID=A0A2K4DV33_9STAP|nr:hypothetical protein [Staphylococcus devriesei]MCE5090576.1 hypothetical protein [Staphylococcus devriesei]MCE5096704.1 hypothetical protein [Staphylococcus devriesei]PNZ90651.1 hypothetical protein CD147_00500 [Staphylococcus devriesei]PTE74024.1 hypothetical protein BUY44_03435 [Staphylococcus devriesei]PTF05274.1 hypothetical protein BUY45_00090 [Staphylococcus devriesei]
MYLKNILLGMIAVILSICLAFLLFIATNQNALAKVHQTISTFSKMGNVSAIENTLNINTTHTAKASEKDNNERKAGVQYNQLQTTEQATNEKHQHTYSTVECKAFAQNYAEQRYGKIVALDQTDETSQDVTFSIHSNQSNQQTEIAVDKIGKIDATYNRGN